MLKWNYSSSNRPNLIIRISRILHIPQADSFSAYLSGLLQTHIDLGMSQYCHT